MDNTFPLVLLNTLALAVGVLWLASLSRKVGTLMSTQAELQNALDVTGTDLDILKDIVGRLVANGGGQNVMTQAQLDAFVAKAQSNRTKADALVEALKPLDTGGGNPPAGQPAITSFAPTTGPEGTPVTIKGSGFGASRGSSTVAFGGGKATNIANWSDTQVEAFTPANAASGEIVITVNGKSATSEAVFHVEPPVQTASFRRR
jgi:hypothetical protein